MNTQKNSFQVSKNCNGHPESKLWSGTATSSVMPPVDINLLRLTIKGKVSIFLMAAKHVLEESQVIQ